VADEAAHGIHILQQQELVAVVTDIQRLAQPAQLDRDFEAVQDEVIALTATQQVVAVVQAAPAVIGVKLELVNLPQGLGVKMVKVETVVLD
jgi:uncharacterized protein YacL (UPF0231 family)